MTKPVFEDIFTFSGRRNRLSYNLYGMAAAVLIIFLPFIFLALISDGQLSNLSEEHGMDLLSSPKAVMIAALLFGPLFVSATAVGAQRCRDISMPGWTILISLIPYVGVIYLVALTLIPGSRGPNRYGDDPLQSADQNGVHREASPSHFKEGHHAKIKAASEETIQSLRQSGVDSKAPPLHVKESHDSKPKTTKLLFAFSFLIVVAIVASIYMAAPHEIKLPSQAARQIEQVVAGDPLQESLIAALRQKPGTFERYGSSSAAIIAYANAGYVTIKPDYRADYGDYRILKKPADFIGHTMVAIEEEYMKEYVGCCVSPGISVTVRISADGYDLDKFASENGCSVTRDSEETYYDIPHGLPAAPKGTYSTLHCKERDIAVAQ